MCIHSDFLLLRLKRQQRACKSPFTKTDGGNKQHDRHEYGGGCPCQACKAFDFLSHPCEVSRLLVDSQVSTATLRSLASVLCEKVNRMRPSDRELTPTSFLSCTENCKQATLTEPKSAKPTGQSLDVLLECVVTNESLLSTAEKTLGWVGSDAVKLSAPTGEGRHFKSKYQNPCKITHFIPF